MSRDLCRVSGFGLFASTNAGLRDSRIQASFASKGPQVRGLRHAAKAIGYRILYPLAVPWDSPLATWHWAFPNVSFFWRLEPSTKHTCSTSRIVTRGSSYASEQPRSTGGNDTFRRQALRLGMFHTHARTHFRPPTHRMTSDLCSLLVRGGLRDPVRGDFICFSVLVFACFNGRWGTKLKMNRS